MKYYILHYDSLGYFAGYKNKIENNYNKSFIFANKYKSLTPILSRLGIDFKGIKSSYLMKRINNNEPIVNFIETLKNQRKRKLNNLIEPKYYLMIGVKIEVIEIEGDDIKKIGTVPDIEIINLIKKEYDKYQVKLKKEDLLLLKYLTANDRLLNSETKTATQEEIDDFCS